ncbi:MAG: IS1 family transposase [Terracidiphilus sp.]
MMNESQSVDGMTCTACEVDCQHFGRHRNGLRRFRCPQCSRTYTEPHTRTLDTMYISQDRAVLALQLLLEGNSIRSTERISGMDRNTIMSLLVKAGKKCQRLMDEKIRNVPVWDVEIDEIWGFCQKKEKSRRDQEKDVYGIGDAWCFCGIERNSKLLLAFHLGKRDRQSTDRFIGKLRYATGDNRFQLTSDGWAAYPAAVGLVLRGRADYAQLIKVYSTPREGEQRYSPGDVVEAVPVPVMGLPKRNRICTSHIERQNLSIRMGMRRMTRLTNAFSKKWENLEAAYALWFAYYNFCRVHSSLRVTPCMEAGIEGHIWTIAELIA